MLHHSIEYKNQEVTSVQMRLGACVRWSFYHFADTIGGPDTLWLRSLEFKLNKHLKNRWDGNGEQRHCEEKNL